MRGACLTSAACAALAPSAASAQNGGTSYVAKPKPAKVLCVSSCASKNAVRGGGTLKVSGKSLSGVSTVIFTGARGTQDDVEVQVDPASDRAIKLKVPMA